MTVLTESLDRQTVIRQIWRDNRWLYSVVGFLLGLLAFPLVQMVITDIANLLTGLMPETVGIVFTVVIIDRLYQRREEQRRVRDLQEQLVRDAASQVNDVANNAVYQLRRHGWLAVEDSLLRGADLCFANLSGVRVEGANLSRANLLGANLSGANLVWANLQGANLGGAMLQGTHLAYAYLEGAKLGGANLAGADLYGANLSGANLHLANLSGAVLNEAILHGAEFVNANLQGANLSNTNLEGADLSLAKLQGAILSNTKLQGAKNIETANFDEKTVLPDAKYIGEDDGVNPIFNKHWTPDTDMTRYTNPKHPDFWQPGWAKAQDSNK